MNPTLVGHAVAVTAIFLTLIFVIAQLKRDRSIINFAWGGGVVLVALYFLWANGTYYPRQLVTTTLTCIWGARLASFLIMRYRTMEDVRFKNWVTSWTMLDALKSAAWTFIGQGIGTFIMALPNILINNYSNAGLNFLDMIGLVVWITGFCLENISDYHLYIFREDPRSKNFILKTGLWRYSRHPNYFGDFLMWLGLALFALSVTYGYYAFLAPLFILCVFWFFSIPKIEKVLARTPGYEEYKRQTSIFVMFPKW